MDRGAAARIVLLWVAALAITTGVWLVGYTRSVEQNDALRQGCVRGTRDRQITLRTNEDLRAVAADAALVLSQSDFPDAAARYEKLRERTALRIRELRGRLPLPGNERAFCFARYPDPPLLGSD